MPEREIVTLKEPAGRGDHKVADGDCIESIALATGHCWRTLWDRPENRDLREAREDPNVLLPGDRVTIPPIEPKELEGATEQKHRFRRNGVPSRLRMVIRDMDDPIANEPFTLIVDGRPSSGETDSAGQIDVPIPPDAREGKLLVGSENPLEFDLDLGSIDPLESVSGIQARLENLGYDPGPVDGRFNEETVGAIARFCEAHDLEPPPEGRMTRDVLDKLEEVHGF